MMLEERLGLDEPCYVISIAAKMVSMHPQTLRYYDRIGLLRPSRSSGRIRLYSQQDVETLRKVARLVEDLGVNLAGVEVILNMTAVIEALRRDLEAERARSQAEIEALRARLRELEERERLKPSTHVINVVAREVTERPRGETS
jgi:MerR family transcriptional regulator/heat shock protein HspR